MPHNITLSDPTFAELQKFARPFLDTPEDAVKKLIAIAKEKGDLVTSSPPPSASSAQTFSPLTPPDLTHTKVLSVEFMGSSLGKGEATWNGLLHKVIVEARRKVSSFSDLKKIIHVNMVDGKKQDEGYHYLSEADLSVQGQDANAAWQAAYHAAERLSFLVDVTFVWRQKEKAAHPGETGRLIIK
jgi:hypothetical protein